MFLRWLILVLLPVSFCGCVSNANYKAESLQQIKRKHEELVENHKQQLNADNYFDEDIVVSSQNKVLAETPSKDNYLLAIGIDRYRHLPNLQTASNDARSVASLLKNKYGFKVKLLMNPTRSEILETVERYRKMLQPENNLIIYYGGHGWFDQEAQQAYWLPSDAHLDDYTKWLSTDTITAIICSMKAKRVMIISDSHYSGIVTRSATVKSEDTNGIEKSSQKNVRVVLSSGTGESFSTPSSNAENSVFCEALLAALNENNGRLQGSGLFTAVESRLSAKNQSTPEYGDIGHSGFNGSDFIFAPIRTSH